MPQGRRCEVNETARDVIGEIEQLAISALCHQPIDFDDAEAHFRKTAGQIVEKAICIVEPYQLGKIAAIISAIVANSAERRDGATGKGGEK